MADALGLPITVAACRETGALGAAIGAALGVGLYPDYEAAVAAMSRAAQAFTPNTTLRPQYDRRYGTYLGLIDALRPFWKKTS
jgi:L-xylulokinase